MGDKQLELMQGIFAPFDMKAWERFREWDAEAAAYLLDAVSEGVTAEQIRDYGQANGYSPQAINWLGHAAAWLGRTLGDTGNIGETPAPSGPPPVSGRGKRINDGSATSDVMYVPFVPYRRLDDDGDVTIHGSWRPKAEGGGALRPPGRTNE